MSRRKLCPKISQRFEWPAVAGRRDGEARFVAANARLLILVFPQPTSRLSLPRCHHATSIRADRCKPDTSPRRVRPRHLQPAGKSAILSIGAALMQSPSGVAGGCIEVAI